METIIKKPNKEVGTLKDKIENILQEYRLKSDELELAEEEWDIGEIQEALANYKKEVEVLKKQIKRLEDKA